MAEWTYLNYSDAERLELRTLLEKVKSFPDSNLAIAINCKYPTKYDEPDLFALIDEIRSEHRITAVASSVDVISWALPLFLEADFNYCTKDTSLSLTDLSLKSMELTAGIIGRLGGKSHGMYLFVKESLSADYFYSRGLITALLNQREISGFEQFFTDFLSGKDQNTLAIIKKTLCSPVKSNLLRSFDIERENFVRCFENGAAEKISQYLRNHLRNKS